MKRSDKGKLRDLHTELTLPTTALSQWEAKSLEVSDEKGKLETSFEYLHNPATIKERVQWSDTTPNRKDKPGMKRKDDDRQGSINEGCSRRDGPVLCIKSNIE
ncbi:hypothetical protein T4D_1086 [Trichinella pseudospiralis]|uniref:Uncharacterized protein n=1 Tax=Trichinella pseudospiralis TaxID=6337 RepID=A0A0V1FYJ0_TRIPS|nr:hypothetical protein T4D_1086 [Trichinella pseudospiralis]